MADPQNQSSPRKISAPKLDQPISPENQPKAPLSDDPLRTAELTWTALIGYWATFAKATLSLPDDVAGDAMRRSVPDIIMLQAVYMALSNLQELDPAEQALGLDRAAVLIDRHTLRLKTAWQSQEPPEMVTELIDDVKRMWQSVAKASADARGRDTTCNDGE